MIPDYVITGKDAQFETRAGHIICGRVESVKWPFVELAESYFVGLEDKEMTRLYNLETSCVLSVDGEGSEP